MAQKKTCGFAISTYGQSMIEDMAEERAREGEEFPGLMTATGEITQKGWDKLGEDISQLEINGLAWLRKNFYNARDEGHDGNDDLIGTLWYSPRSKKQLELLELGVRERVDMSDAGYGDFAKAAFKGVSDFGEAVLGGQINFFDVKEDF